MHFKYDDNVSIADREHQKKQHTHDFYWFLFLKTTSYIIINESMVAF